MKSWKTIMEESGIEIPEDKESDLNKAIAENYKTVAEFDQKMSKANDYKTQVETLTADRDKLKGIVESFDGAEPDKIKQLQTDYETLKADLEKRDADEQRKNETKNFSDSMDAAVGDRKFANALVKDAVYRKVAQMHEADQSKGLADLLEEATKDTDGVWENIHQDAKPLPKPTGGEDQEDAAIRAAMGLKPKEK